MNTGKLLSRVVKTSKNLGLGVSSSLIVERDCIRLLDLDCNKPFVFEKYTVLLIVKCTSARGRKKSPTVA